MKTHTYKIIVADEECRFIDFVREHKFDGYLYPNLPEGDVWHLEITEDMILLLALKFNLKSYSKFEN